MNVLISSYSCSPYLGSENALGWNSVISTLRAGHKVWVLTRDYNKNDIERYLGENCELKKEEINRLQFEYIEVDIWIQKIKGHIGEILQYITFQKNIFMISKKLTEKYKFDYVHHVSWASLVQRIYLYKLNTPFILGPVGGGEETPKIIDTEFSLKYKLKEIIRKMFIVLSTNSPWFKEMCKRAKVIFVTTEETYRYIPMKYRNKTYIKQAIGIDKKALSNEKEKKDNKRIQVLMAGRLIYWKGFDIGIAAIKKLLEDDEKVDLHIIGNGNEKDRLINLCGEFYEKGIYFHGNVPYENMNNIYKRVDIFLNTSLHDSGCMVILEAMSKRVPIVCIDTGGPKILTDTSCAFKIKPNKKEKMIEEIVCSIKKLIKNSELREDMGVAAYKRVVNNFEFEKKYKDIGEIIINSLIR